MKVHHIRKNNQIVATLVAVKSEAKNVVNIGYSLAMKGDNSKRSQGYNIALGRALTARSLKVPHKLKREYRDFIEHCHNWNEFNGFHIPVLEDFEFTSEPINVQKSKRRQAAA